jgi:flagellin-like hook-associated protein FlgL
MTLAMLSQPSRDHISRRLDALRIWWNSRLTLDRSDGVKTMDLQISMSSPSTSAPARVAGIPLNVLIPAALTLGGCVLTQWYSIRSMTEQNQKTIVAQQEVQKTTVSELRSAIIASGEQIEKRMTERLTSAQQLQEANQRSADIQRTFLEHRINSLESGTAALRETPAAVAALTTRIDKFEAALDAMQQIRLQLGSVENKLSSLAESQAKMERTVEKLTVSK